MQENSQQNISVVNCTLNEIAVSDEPSVAKCANE